MWPTDKQLNNSKRTMKNSILAAVLLISASAAVAQETKESDHQFTGTATVVSDYIFRGTTQTWHRPALQGSLDYAHASGLFATLWASTVSEKVVAGARSEFDLVLGYKGALTEDVSYGGGLATVYYPGGNWNKMKWGPQPDQRYDFTEANVFVGYRWLSAKYSRSLTDLLGFNEKTGFSASTKGSTYVELNAEIPLSDTGFTLGLHAGREDFKATMGGLDPDFNDYRISLSKTFAGGWMGSVQVSENTNKGFFDAAVSNENGADIRDVGKRRVVVSLTRMF
jgi:uncharacterized protein (TIGR02001 family)